MDAKLLIEADPHETRIAILEDDRLAELFVERAAHRGVVGNIYKGRVSRVLPGMQAAFCDIGQERDAFLYVDDVTVGGEQEERPEDEPPSPPAPIEDLLRTGQELILQVYKDPLPTKGARVTAQVTLPGRYLVYAPLGRHRGVSRRIEDPDERQRLRELMEELRFTGGLIVRTAGEGLGPEAFQQDGTFLVEMWQKIQRRGAETSAPYLVHQDLDVVLRVVRDRFGPDFSVLWVDDDATYCRIAEFLDQIQPALLPRVKVSRSEESLFERFGIEAAIEEALQPKVWLKSGGHIVINPTEALVAVDVNTGRYVGHHDLEQTILDTNLEAVREIVRQVRLRNLGGIIVIDLIDMTEPEHRERVFAALEEELRKDRSRNKVLSISEFGLVELTRKRTRPSLERLLTESCPYCHGRGRIKSLTTICLAVRREVLRSSTGILSREVVLRVNPEVARALQREERRVLDELERELGVTVVVQSDPGLHHERFEVTEL